MRSEDTSYHNIERPRKIQRSQGDHLCHLHFRKKRSCLHRGHVRYTSDYLTANVVAIKDVVLDLVLYPLVSLTYSTRFELLRLV